MTLSRRKRNEIERLTSVADDVLRERNTSRYGDRSECFLDDPPEFWSTDQKELFDIAYEIENRLKEKVFEVLDRKDERRRQL